MSEGVAQRAVRLTDFQYSVMQGQQQQQRQRQPGDQTQPADCEPSLSSG